MVYLVQVVFLTFLQLIWGKYTDETDILFADQLSQIQSLSEGLDQLDKIYADVLDKEDFD